MQTATVRNATMGSNAELPLYATLQRAVVQAANVRNTQWSTMHTANLQWAIMETHSPQYYSVKYCRLQLYAKIQYAVFQTATLRKTTVGINANYHFLPH
jgi:hypothetical protein